MNFHVSRGKWIVCQIYFRRSKHSVDCATIDHIFFCQWNCTIGSGNWNVRLCSNCRCVQSWKWFISNGTAGTTGIGNSMPSPASFRLNQSSWSFDSVLFESCRRLNILKSQLSRTPEKQRIFYLDEQHKKIWIHIEW